MLRQCPDPREARRCDGHVEMPALAGSGMSGVFLAVVADLQQGGCQRLLQRRPQAIDSTHGSPAAVSRGACRSSAKITKPVKTSISGMMIQALKVTQADSLMV